MLSTLLFSGISFAQIDRSTNLLNRLDQQNLVSEEHRRSEIAEIAEVSDDLPILGATSLWKARGVEPQDGLIVYINGQVEANWDGEFGTEYDMLTANGNAKGCKFERAYSTYGNPDLSEQLWVLESSGHYLGPTGIPDLYEAFFLRSLEYPNIRMSYFWDDSNTDNPYLSLTCGTQYTERHQWIFQDITADDATWEEGSRYQIINRKYGMVPKCRMTSMNYENLVSGGMHYPNGEYICNTDLWGETDVSIETDFSIDSYYKYFSIPGFIAPNLQTYEDDIIVYGNYRDIKLVNPFDSEAGWDVVAGTAVEVNGEIQWTYTYRTGISNKITSTNAEESTYEVSVSASVGASAFGMDVSTEVATSFGQSFSESYSSGLTLETATTVTLEILVPANTCVELLQLYSTTDNQFEQASFDFKSNQLKLRCCVGKEDENPDYCSSESLAHRATGEQLSNDFTGEDSVPL